MSRPPADPIDDLARVLARINVRCAEVREKGRRLQADGRLVVKNTKAGAVTPAGKGVQP